MNHYEPTIPFSFRELVTVAEGAAIAQMHQRSIYRLIKQGKLRCFGRRGAYRILLGELLPEVKPSGTE